MERFSSDKSSFDLEEASVISDYSVRGKCSNVGRTNFYFSVSAESMPCEVHLQDGWYNSESLAKEVQRAMNTHHDGEYKVSLIDGKLHISSTKQEAFSINRCKLLGFTKQTTLSVDHIADTVPGLKTEITVNVCLFHRI